MFKVPINYARLKKKWAQLCRTGKSIIEILPVAFPERSFLHSLVSHHRSHLNLFLSVCSLLTPTLFATTLQIIFHVINIRVLFSFVI